MKNVWRCGENVVSLHQENLTKENLSTFKNLRLWKRIQR